MSEAIPSEALKTQDDTEVVPPKPPRTAEEEAAHLLKKAQKKEEKAEKKKAKRNKRRLTLGAITLSVFLSWLGSTVFVMFHTGSLPMNLGRRTHGSSSHWRVTRWRLS